MSTERPFRPAWTVRAQIRWDPRLDPDAFTVCYADRIEGERRVPFRSYVPGGRVPWLRITAFRRDGRVVWDRAARVDALRELPPAPAPRPARGQLTPLPSAGRRAGCPTRTNAFEYEREPQAASTRTSTSYRSSTGMVCWPS